MLYDLAIIGGGPAAVAAGVYASRKQLRTIFITKDFGGQSVVSDGIENWIGTIKISGTDLAKNLEAHIRAYADGIDIKEPIVEIKTGELCQNISKSGQNDGSNFIIKTDKAFYSARTVLIATGSDRRKIDVPGADIFEHKGLTYCASCDGPLFAGQDVAVIGGGNAGFESAAQLLAYCKSVTLLNISDKLRADPTTVAAVIANPKMKLINNAIPKEVKGDKFVTSLIYTEITKGGSNDVSKDTSRDVELPVTGIFVEIGSVPTTYFAKDLAIIDQFGRIVVDPRNQRTSVDGVWAAGDATDGIYHQNNIAAGDAVKALEDIYIYISKL